MSTHVKGEAAFSSDEDTQQTFSKMTTKSVLLIGATGALGRQCLRRLAEEPSVDQLHVFCRTPKRLSTADRALCDSITLGDARITRDVEDALEKSQATHVILATGNGRDLGESDTRQATARALADAMKQRRFLHVRAIVVSRTGAGDSKIMVGLGMGYLVSHRLKHVLLDHTLQEDEFSNLLDRTLIVRPTFLTTDKPGKTLVEFGNSERAPTIHVDRGDVASWIVQQVAKDAFLFCGGKLNVTSAR